MSTLFRQEKFRLRRDFTRAYQEKLICFAGEYFYAKKGDKTTQFLAAVQPEMNPWDSSFAGFEMSNVGGMRYNLKRGVVGHSPCPFGRMFSLAREETHSGGSTNYTNRLAWGAVRDPDVVIGTGIVRSFKVWDTFNFDYVTGVAERTSLAEIIRHSKGDENGHRQDQSEDSVC
jgi:hypothetical protein